MAYVLLDLLRCFSGNLARRAGLQPCVKLSARSFLVARDVDAERCLVVLVRCDRPIAERTASSPPRLLTTREIPHTPARFHGVGRPVLKGPCNKLCLSGIWWGWWGNYRLWNQNSVAQYVPPAGEQAEVEEYSVDPHAMPLSKAVDDALR
jgi:hypothetical protein